MNFDISKLAELTNHQSLNENMSDYDTSFENDPHFIAEKSEFMKNIIPDFDAEAFAQEEMKIKQKNNIDESLKALGVKLPAVEKGEPVDFLQEALKKRKSNYPTPQTQNHSVASGKSDMLLEQILLELRNLNRNLAKQETKPVAPINESVNNDTDLEKKMIKMILALKKKGII